MWLDQFLLKRRLNDNEPAVRIEAIEALNSDAHSVILGELAREDDSPDVRLAAFAKIQDCAELESLVQQEQHAQTAARMRELLDRRYANIVIASDVGEVDAPELDKIQSEAVLGEVALQASSASLALAVMAKVRNNPEVVKRILTGITLPDAVRDLFEMVAPDTEMRSFLLCHAASPVIRDLAAARPVVEPTAPDLKQDCREQEPEPPQPEEEIVRELEALAASGPDDVKYERLVREFQAFEAPAPHCEERFYAAKYRYRERCEALSQEKQQQEELEHKKAIWREHLEKIDPQRGIPSALMALNALSREFAAAGWEDSVLERMLQEKRNQLEQLDFNFREALRQLEGWVVEMEQLPDAPDVDGNAKTLHALREKIRNFFETESSQSAVLAPEFAELKSRAEAADRAFHHRLRELYQVRDLERWEHYTLKMDICLEMERLANLSDTELANSGNALRKLRERYFALGAVPQEKFAELKMRFQTCSGILQRRLDDYFQKRNDAWSQAERIKREICEEAEKLSSSEDWEATADKLKLLQASWKSCGTTRPALERELFQRFHQACDAFFTRRNQVWEARKLEMQAACSAKAALCAEVEQCVSESFDAARKHLTELRRRWNALPMAGREERILQQRFRAASDMIFSVHRSEQENNRRKMEIACTAMTDLAEKLQQNCGEGQPGFETQFRQIVETYHQAALEIQNPEPEIESRWHAIRQQVLLLLNERQSRILMHQLQETRQMERFSSALPPLEQLQDHAQRRLMLCEELEGRLAEMGIAAPETDLGNLLTRAICGNSGQVEPLTAEELEDFVRRFLGVGAVPEEERESIFDRFEQALRSAWENLSHA